MANSSGSGRHRRRHAEQGAGQRVEQRTGQRAGQRAGLVVAVVGGGVLGVTQTLTTTGLLPVIQRDVLLTDNWSLDSTGVVAASTGDTAAAYAGGYAALPNPAAGTVPFPAANTFDQSLYYLLNDMLGIGTKTPGQLFPVGDTVGDALAYSGLSTATQLNSTSPDLMGMLGLNNITIEDVLNAFQLEPTKSVDQILDQMQLGNVTLDFLLTPLGIPSTQTTMGLAHRFSVAHLTLGELMGRAGYSTNDTMGQLLNKMGLGGTALPGLLGAGSLIGSMTCPANVSADMTVDQFLQCILLDGIKAGGTDSKNHNLPTEIHVNKNTTIEQLLASQHFYDANSNHTSKIIGNWTLGEILSQKAGSPSIPPGGTPFIFNSTTTVKDLLDHIHVNTTSVGTPDQGSVPQLIFPYGTGAGTGSPVYTQDPSTDSGGTAVPPGSTSQMLPTLGSTNFGTLLSWMNLDPNKSLGEVLTDSFWVGNHLAGTSTIGDALDGLVVNPLAIGPIGSHVTDATTLSDLLDGMFGSLTINDLLGL